MEYEPWGITPARIKESGYLFVKFKRGSTDPYDIYLKRLDKIRNIGSVRVYYPKAVFPEPEPSVLEFFDVRLNRKETKSVGLSISAPFIGAGIERSLLESSEIRFHYSNAEEYAVDYNKMEPFFRKNSPEDVPDFISGAEDGDILMVTGILRAREFEMYVSTTTETGQGIELDVNVINDNIDVGSGFKAKTVAAEGNMYKVWFSSQEESLPLAVATRFLIYNEFTKRFGLGDEPYRP